jgi:hypothetical protein
MVVKDRLKVIIWVVEVVPVLEETKVGVEDNLRVVIEVEGNMMVETGVSLVARTEVGVVAEEEGMLVERTWVEGSLIREEGKVMVVTGEEASLKVELEVGETLVLIEDEGGPMVGTGAEVSLVVPEAEDGCQKVQKVWDRMLQGVEVRLGQGVEVGQGAMDKLESEVGDKMVQVEGGNVVVHVEEDSMMLPGEMDKLAEVVEEAMMAFLFYLVSRQ